MKVHHFQEKPGEMEKQWLAVEQINTVTGADKYCTEKPSPNPFK